MIALIARPILRTLQSFVDVGVSACEGPISMVGGRIIRRVFSEEPQMGKKLFVGNLPYQVADDELYSLFEPHGTVVSAQVIVDRDTGRSKGFGFVEMDNDQEAQTAIEAMNGHDVDGRALTVNEARPRTDRGGGGGRSGGRDRW